MSDDLSTVDAAQLERWAYGRTTTADEQARATAALAELQRRSAAELERAHREAAERVTAEAHAREYGDVETDAEPLTDSERRHRRRMLITGIAGLTAAALSLGAGVYVLTQPDPDPLAIFEREETQLDLNWMQRLSSWGFGTITAGPRAVDVDGDYVMIASRMSTVPDGRSTEWDAYCLHLASPATTDDGSWGLSTTCAYPEKFEREGLTLPDRPSATGEGFDTAYWGPDGEPSFARNQPLYGETGLVSSVLDTMAQPWFDDFDVAGESIIDFSERLLMGPVLIPLFPEGADAAAFRESGIEARALLVSGERPSDSPRLCVHVSAGFDNSRLPCAALGTVRREGLEVVPLTVNGHNWVVTIGADGRDRSDTVRRVDQ